MSMDFKEAIQYLEGADTTRIYPIFVPSIFRPGHKLYTTVIAKLPKAVKDKVYYVVRHEQREEYKAAQPDVNILALPKDLPEGFGLDSTRMMIEERARKMGYRKILDIDDDIDLLTFVYDAGKTTRRLRKADRERLVAQILARMCQEADEVFNRFPRAVMGSPCRIFPSTAHKDYSRTRWIVNGMSIPRQFMLKNVQRMAELGIYRTGQYDKHCEDVGFAATVLGMGGHLFRVPSFIYEVPTHEANPRTEAILHKAEPEELWQDGEKRLRESAIGEFLTYTSAQSDRGRKPRPVGVNWKQWNEHMGWGTTIKEWGND